MAVVFKSIGWALKSPHCPPSCSASLQEILQQGHRGREHCTCPLQVFVITTKNVSLCVSKCPLSSWKSPLESLCPTSLRCSLRLCCTVAKNLCPMMPFLGLSSFPFSIFSALHYVHQGSYSRGGGYLVYLSDGDVPFFRVSFSPIFSRTGYQKKANFLEQVVKTSQKRKFCQHGLFFSPIFAFF